MALSVAVMWRVRMSGFFLEFWYEGEGDDYRVFSGGEPLGDLADNVADELESEYEDECGANEESDD